MASPRRYDGLHELTYLFHDRDVSSPAVAAACATRGSTPPLYRPAKHSPSRKPTTALAREHHAL